MNRSRRFFLRHPTYIAFRLLFFSVPLFAWAEEFTSTSFRLLDPVIAPSGFGTSTDYELRGSISEPALGASAIANFRLNPGFLLYPFVSVPVVSAVSGNNKVALSWTEAEGFLGLEPSGYSIGQSLSSGGPYTYAPININITFSNRTGLTNGTTYYFVLVVEDAFGNPVATSSEVSRTPVAPVAVTPSANRITIQSNAEYAITIPSGVNDAKIDVSGITAVSGATTTAVVSGAMNLNAETEIGHVDVDFPEGVSIRGPSGTWDGTINAPQVQSNSSVTPTPDAGKIASVTAAIEIGAGDVPLTFDKAVRILIADQAGAFVGYSRSDIFTPIADICSSDSQEVADALPDGDNCTIDVGSDLVIWTKHFTVFVTYTQESTISDSDADSESGGGKRSGEGGIIGSLLANPTNHISSELDDFSNPHPDAPWGTAQSFFIPSFEPAETIALPNNETPPEKSAAPSRLPTRKESEAPPSYQSELILAILAIISIVFLMQTKKPSSPLDNR